MYEPDRQTKDGQTSLDCEAACRSQSVPIRKQEIVLLHLHAGQRIVWRGCGATNPDWLRKEKDWCRQKRSRIAPLLDGVDLRTNGGGINQEISATIKGWKLPASLICGSYRKPLYEVLSCLPHHLGKRPVLLRGDFFQSPVERIRELNLGSNHDVVFTPQSE